MIAVWILLALAVLFGGAILALTIYAVRHDDRRPEAAGAPAGPGADRPTRRPAASDSLDDAEARG